MEKLVEFLTTKLGYVLMIILGFIAPGNVLIFVWNRDIYLAMDVIKLLILSFAVSFIAFIPNLIAVIIIYFIHGYEKELDTKQKFKFDVLYCIGCTVVINIIEMIGIIFLEICGKNQLKVYVMYSGLMISGMTIVLGIVLIIKIIKGKITK